MTFFHAFLRVRIHTIKTIAAGQFVLTSDNIYTV